VREALNADGDCALVSTANETIVATAAIRCFMEVPTLFTARVPRRISLRCRIIRSVTTVVYTFESPATLALSKRLVDSGKVSAVIFQRPMTLAGKLTLIRRRVSRHGLLRGCSFGPAISGS
jgi:hypothetical protein